MIATTMPNVVTTADELSTLVAEYQQHEAFCFDLETTGDYRLNPRRNVVEVMALATDGRHDVVPMAFTNGALDWIEYPLTATGKLRQVQARNAGLEYTPRKTDISVDNKKATYHWHSPPPHLNRETAFAILEPLLMGDSTKVGHNLKFDLSSVYKYIGHRFPTPPYADTMVAAYLVNSGWRYEDQDKDNRFKPYSLKAVCKRETGYEMTKGVGENITLHPWNEVMKYAALDAKYTWLSWRMLRRKLKRDDLMSVMALEMDILGVLLGMEQFGAPIDQQELRALDERLLNPKTGLLSQAEARCYVVAGRKFQIGKQEAKAHLLYAPKEEGGQGLTPLKWTPGGTHLNKTTGKPTPPKPSVSADALEPYRKRNKLVAALLDHSDLAKLHNTYVDPYLNGSHVRGVEAPQPLVVDGRIHAQFNQVGAATGRFSCHAPNLQNVPNASTEMGRAIRGLFVAPHGHQLVVADFSQIELRVLAHLSNDATMMRAFLAGEDIHQATADALGVSRPEGKALNFAIVFSAGPDKVADMATTDTHKVSPAQAAKFMDLYDERFPGISKWKREVVNACRRADPPCVRTLTGRVRHLPDILNAERWIRAAAERQASNTIVQGSAADIIKLAMVRAHQTLPEECHLILTVHDELVTIAPDEMAEKAALVIGEAMTGAYQLRVPIPADITIVKRWSDAKS